MTDDALLALRRQMASDLPTAGDEDRSLFLCQAAELGDVATVSEILEWPLPKAWVEQALAGADWETHAEALTATLPTVLGALKGRHLGHAGFAEALAQAVKAGQEDAVRMLLDHAGVGATGPHPPLQVNMVLDDLLTQAVRQGHRQVVHDLLRRGVAPRQGVDSSLYAAVAAGRADLLGDLLKVTPLMDVVRQDLLNKAAGDGHLACVQQLWDATITPIGFSKILATAAHAGHLALVEDLVTRGSSGYLKALNQSAQEGHTDVVRFLMTKTDPRQENSYPLLKAIRYGHKETFEALLPVSCPDPALHLIAAAKLDHPVAAAMIVALIPRCDVVAGAAILVQEKYLDQLDRLASLCPADLRTRLMHAFPGVHLPRTQAQIRHEHLSSREPTRSSRRTRS